MLLSPIKREAVRCPHCDLNQFKTLSGDCRKCHQSLTVAELPLPVKEAVIIDSNFMLPPIGSKMDAAIAVTSKTLRGALNLSQKEAAKRSGFARQYFTRIEHGTVSLSVPSLARLASIFDLSLSNFMQIIETVAHGE